MNGYRDDHERYHKHGPSTDDFGFEVHDPLHGIDTGPCSDFAPDTLGDDPRVCTTCFYSGIDHRAPTGGPCAKCGREINDTEHAIFGGSPTFHGYMATGT